MKQVCYCRDAMEAHFLRGLLEGEGIRACVLGESLAAARGDLPMTQQTLPSLWVEAEDMEQACVIVREAMSGTYAETDSGPWTCPACGEGMEAPFSACWHCGQARPEQAPP